MSVNVVAILDHGLDASHVQALPRALHPQAAPQLATATARLFTLLKPFYPLLSEDGGWHVKPYHAWTISDPETAWAQGGLMEVDGPALGPRFLCPTMPPRRACSWPGAVSTRARTTRRVWPSP